MSQKRRLYYSAICALVVGSGTSLTHPALAADTKGWRANQLSFEDVDQIEDHFDFRAKMTASKPDGSSSPCLGTSLAFNFGFDPIENRFEPFRQNQMTAAARRNETTYVPIIEPYSFDDPIEDRFDPFRN